MQKLTESYTLNMCSLLCADNDPIQLAQEKEGKGKEEEQQPAGQVSLRKPDTRVCTHVR